MDKKALLASLAICVCSPVYAQGASAPQPDAPMPVVAATAAPTAVLPANTEVLMAMNQEVTTKGDRWKEGDNFDMSVVNDVTFGHYVIIPKGSRGVGCWSAADRTLPHRNVHAGRMAGRKWPIFPRAPWWRRLAGRDGFCREEDTAR